MTQWNNNDVLINCPLVYWLIASEQSMRCIRILKTLLLILCIKIIKLFCKHLGIDIYTEDDSEYIKYINLQLFNYKIMFEWFFVNITIFHT